LLEDYKETSIMNIPLGTHVRYFSTVDNKKLFRRGGFLKLNNGLPKYVILSNGKNDWSVQVKNTVFYKKMSIKEIKEEYEDYIEELLANIEKLNKIVKLYKQKCGES